MDDIKISFLKGKVSIASNEFTKDVEIELFQQFYDSLPTDSYLKGYLKGMAWEIESNIRNDFWYVPIEIIADLTNKCEVSLKEVEILKDRTLEISKDREKSTEYFNELTTKLRTEIQDLTQNLETKTKQVNELSEENERLSQEAKSQKALYDLEIMELKAKLYDASQINILRKVI